MRRPRLCHLAAAARGALLLAALGLGGLVVLPAAFGYRASVITGGSMEPTIPLGALVVSRPVPIDALRPGDVVTYVPPADTGVTGAVTHRIVSVEDDSDGRRSFRTKGDANPTADPWRFTLDRTVLPRLTLTVPAVGRLLTVVRSPWGRFLLVAVPASLAGLRGAADLIGALRQRRSTARSTATGVTA